MYQSCALDFTAKKAYCNQFYFDEAEGFTIFKRDVQGHITGLNSLQDYEWVGPGQGAISFSTQNQSFPQGFVITGLIKFIKMRSPVRADISLFVKLF